jgi:hypothetical protein
MFNQKKSALVTRSGGNAAVEQVQPYAPPEAEMELY